MDKRRQAFVHTLVSGQTPTAGSRQFFCVDESLFRVISEEGAEVSRDPRPPESRAAGWASFKVGHAIPQNLGRGASCTHPTGFPLLLCTPDTRCRGLHWVPPPKFVCWSS